MSYLLALDQGTSSSRSILFDREGRQVACAQQEFRQIFPQPGWVEHDAEEIWQSQLATCRQVLQQAGVSAQDVAALGITNQRETTVLWERASGRPLCNAIVWQDRRTAAACDALRARGLEDAIRAKTGLVLDAYFSGTKLAWMLDHVPGARERAERGELAFGTIDAWLAWHLSGGALHVTDVSNASRTMLWNLEQQCWDAELLEWLDIPASLLPQVHPSAHAYGQTSAALLGAPVLIGGIAGDQQAALFGQGCIQPGMAKNTYGTGCFMLMHTGTQRQTSRHGLLATAAAQVGAQAQYALEGSVFIGGAVVQWLRDGLHAIKSSSEVQVLAESVPDAGGVVLVPAFTGLGAPYWQPQAQGAILGLSRGTSMAHIARAALESIALQSAALLQAMAADAASPLQALRVDGGAARNDLLMQFQADLLGIPVIRPQITESTALGAALLAGLTAGLWPDQNSMPALHAIERSFEPQISRAQAAEKMAAWEKAVRQVVTQ
ncbi:glycerol kinase GlpK [Massilia sp. W12]|uniref:glycerol kinase GlpK n=1 Tax=Massilia sp. W12 TaxID=3126507 RepID=UPI0030CE79CE